MEGAKGLNKVNLLNSLGLFIFLSSATLYNCGGPKKIIFNINGQIQKPQDIPEEEYRRISPVISKIAANIISEVKDEDGNIIEKKTTKASISEGKVSARVDFTVEDLSQIVNIKADSQRLIIFSKDIFSDKFEKTEDLQYCQEGDIDKDGYDYICTIDFSVTPNISDSIRNYIEFRERLSKAEEKQFCSVYITVSQEINNLQVEIRETAISDISDVYNTFVDKIRNKANEVFSKIKNRDCSEKAYLETIKDYFCLPEKIISESKKMIQTCEAYTLYDEGTALLKKGQTTKALDKFRESIRIKPDFSDSYIAIG
ncbi:MAG: tetratricopeptide repeat protein, partial [Candidatus Pacearchaeota archaeon]